MNDPYDNLAVGQLLQALPYCFHSALGIRLHDDVELFHAARLDLVEEVIKGYFLCPFHKLLSVFCADLF